MNLFGSAGRRWQLSIINNGSADFHLRTATFSFWTHRTCLLPITNVSRKENSVVTSGGRLERTIQLHFWELFTFFLREHRNCPGNRRTVMQFRIWFCNVRGFGLQLSGVCSNWNSYLFTFQQQLTRLAFHFAAVIHSQLLWGLRYSSRVV